MHTGKERILVKKVNGKGYEYVCLCKNDIRTYPRIHRLVAELFIENPENKEQVNHIDGNKRNNRVDNLEWCTQSENIRHAIRNGLLNITGSNNGNSRKVQQLDLDGNILRQFDTIVEAGKYVGAKGKPTSITGVCRGNKKTAYGYKWKYIN